MDIRNFFAKKGGGGGGGVKKKVVPSTAASSSSSGKKAPKTSSTENGGGAAAARTPAAKSSKDKDGTKTPSPPSAKKDGGGGSSGKRGTARHTSKHFDKMVHLHDDDDDGASSATTDEDLVRSMQGQDGDGDEESDEGDTRRQRGAKKGDDGDGVGNGGRDGGRSKGKKRKARVVIESSSDDDDNTTDNDDFEEEKKSSPTSTKSKKNTATKRSGGARTEVTAEDFFAGTASASGGKDKVGRGKVASTPDAKKPKRGPSSSPSSSSKGDVEADDDDDDEHHDDDNDGDYNDDDERLGKAEDHHLDDGSDDGDFEDRKSPRSATRRSTPPRRAKKASSPPAKKSSVVKAPRPTPTAKKTPKSKSTTSAKKKKAEKLVPIVPNDPIPEYPLDEATPGCLEGWTFVFTGVLPDLGREDAEDYIKCLGGRVTSAVSGKTNYLVCGDELEDGRDVTEGAKYKRASGFGPEKCAIIRGEGMFYAVARALDDRFREVRGLGPRDHGNKEKEDEGAAKADAAKDDGGGKASAASAPAAAPRPAVANPYARVSNPYAKKAASASAKTSTSAASSNPYAKRATPSGPTPPATKEAWADDPMALWADKYAPRTSREILGNQESVRKLGVWLAQWEGRFNRPNARNKSFAAPGGPWKAALLSGAPGIGKTTTALLVAEESGRDVLEFNASDVRSKKMLAEGLGDVTGSQVLDFGGKAAATTKGGKKGSSADSSAPHRKRCIIMDEVDGMGAGDRSGIAELIKMIKASMVPIICICNDRQSQKIRSLVPYCLDLRYRRPVKSVIARRAVEIGRMEGMHVEPNAAEAIAESCGNDIRQVLNCLQMWSNKTTDGDRKADMTYRDVKERQGYINKDEMLRVTMFDATKMIVEGPRGVASSDPKAANDSFFKRSDAFFTDYNLMGLNVHQNYLKVMISQFQETKRQSDAEAELAVVDRMFDATQSMSDFALAEEGLRGGQNWQLLPLCAILTVKAGFHGSSSSGGFLPGYPEFAGWLGKNSTRGRMARLLQELRHHMNYRISGDSRELRLQYIPVLRTHFLKLLTDKSGIRTEEVIELMDEYGLDRDDLFEGMDELVLDSNAAKFANLDSKSKAAFTREYNKGVHKSQALVDEQGVTKKKKAKTVSETEEAQDLDAVNDDKVEAEDDDDDDEMDAEAIKSLFKKKGRGSNASKAKAEGKAKGKGAKRRKK